MQHHQMRDLIEQHRGELAAICRQFGVRQLELFGSAARGEDVSGSDLDFLVAFERTDQRPAEERYFGLQEALSRLFDRPVDLVDIATARNPFFIANALKHRVRLYAA